MVFLNTVEEKSRSFISGASSAAEAAKEDISLGWQTTKKTFLTIFIVLFWTILIGIILVLLIKFNLVPHFILRFLRDLKGKWKIVKIIYYFIYALPCLFVETAINTAQGYRNTPEGTFPLMFMMVMGLLVLFLLPCFIRYLYLRTPWNISGSWKSSFREKVDMAKKAVDSLEEKINFRRQMTPGIMWSEDWLVSNPNAAQKAKMQEKLLAMGYWLKFRGPSKMKKARLALKDIAKCYITPSIPFYGTIKCWNGLKESLKASKPNVNTTLAFIQANLEDMKRDMDEHQRLKIKYDDLSENFDEYVETYTTKQIINDPIYTDYETTNDEWHFENLKKGNVYNYKYAISAWIFIHNQPISRGPYYANYASIFNYGDKPNILYNMKEQNLRITVSNNKQNSSSPNQILFETKELPMQKWNNIVINFDGGTLDIYLNNKLVASEPNIIPYKSLDEIKIGQENGLSGGICNVVYFPEVLSRTKMTLFYETLKWNNPPVLPYCIFS